MDSYRIRRAHRFALSGASLGSKGKSTLNDRRNRVGLHAGNVPEIRSVQSSRNTLWAHGGSTGNMGWILGSGCGESERR